MHFPNLLVFLELQQDENYIRLFFVLIQQYQISFSLNHHIMCGWAEDKYLVLLLFSLVWYHTYYNNKPDSKVDSK